MAETKTQHSKAAKATAAQGRPAASRPKTAVEKTAGLSKEVAQSVEDSQRAAIEAVRKLVDTVDHTLPALPHDEGRPDAGRSSTPRRWRWPTEWSTCSTTSSARPQTARVRR